MELDRWVRCAGDAADVQQPGCPFARRPGQAFDVLGQPEDARQSASQLRRCPRAVQSARRRPMT